MTVTSSEPEVRRRAVRLDIAEVARFLQDLFGQKTTAAITGIRDAKAVGEWARGERKPAPRAARTLRDTHQVAVVLLQVESAETVKAWFLGMNPDLDDELPADVISKDPKRVLQAARTFLTTG